MTYTYDTNSTVRRETRHDCGEACACARQGVDPKLFELEARHGRLLTAAREILECTRGKDPTTPLRPCEKHRAALAHAIAECEAGP